MTTEATIEDQLVKGLKLGAVGSFAPQSGKLNGTAKTAYKMDMVHVNGDVDLDHAGAVAHGAVVLG